MSARDQSFPAALAIQGRVLHALILREMTGRYGGTRLGYLWGLANPVIAIGILYVVFSVLDRLAPPGMPLLLFLVTGYLTWTFFTSTANRCMGAIEANQALLMYPPVTALDVLLSRWGLEIMTFTVILFIYGFLGILIEGPYWPANPQEVIFSFWSAGLMALGLGLIVSAAKAYAKSIENIVAPILRIGFFLSGVIFTAQMLPSWTHPYLYWNPMAHVIEMVREGWFDSYVSPIADPGYVAVWIVSLLFVGIVAERVARRRQFQ